MFTQHDFLYLLLLMLSKIITFKRFQQKKPNGQTESQSPRYRVRSFMTYPSCWVFCTMQLSEASLL